MTAPSSTPSKYQDFQVGLQPPWLQGPYGSSWGASLGSVKDMLVTKTQNAVKCQFIATPTQVPFGPTDALAFNGADRGIDRGPSETDAAYAARVLNAWNIWPFAGTPTGLLKALYDGGYPHVTMVQQLGQEYTISVDGSGNVTLNALANAWRWVFDAGSPALTAAQAQLVAWGAGQVKAAGAIVVPSPRNGFWYQTSGGGTTGTTQPSWPTTVGAYATDNGFMWQCKGRDFWSRFGLLFTQPFPASWAGTPPGDSTDEVKKIRKIVAKWKPAHATCVLLAAMTGDGVNNGQTWDFRPAGATWDSEGTGRTTWNSLTTATFWTPPSN